MKFHDFRYTRSVSCSNLFLFRARCYCACVDVFWFILRACNG